MPHYLHTIYHHSRMFLAGIHLFRNNGYAIIRWLTDGHDLSLHSLEMEIIFLSVPNTINFGYQDCMFSMMALANSEVFSIFAPSI